MSGLAMHVLLNIVFSVRYFCECSPALFSVIVYAKVTLSFVKTHVMSVVCAVLPDS